MLTEESFLTKAKKHLKKYGKYYAAGTAALAAGYGGYKYLNKSAPNSKQDVLPKTDNVQTDKIVKPKISKNTEPKILEKEIKPISKPKVKGPVFNDTKIDDKPVRKPKIITKPTIDEKSIATIKRERIKKAVNAINSGTYTNRGEKTKAMNQAIASISKMKINGYVNDNEKFHDYMQKGLNAINTGKYNNDAERMKARHEFVKNINKPS